MIFYVAVAFAPAGAATYDIDPSHTRIGFAVKHMVISVVKGEFQKFSGTFELDEAGVLTGAEAAIDTASVYTRDKKRDDHLRSPDFFDAENHPKITFVSKRITNKGNKYTVIGDLTIRGVTKSIILTGEKLGEATDPWGNHRAGFQAEGKINRKDFGVSFHKVLETGGFVVGDEVTLSLDVEGIKRKAPGEEKAKEHKH